MNNDLNKKEIIQELRRHFADELATCTDAQRIQELNRWILSLDLMPSRNYGPEEPIIPSSLVELKIESTRSYCFLVTHGGGQILSLKDIPIQVVTAQSPLGENLLGKKAGESFTVISRSGAERVYQIISAQ